MKKETTKKDPTIGLALSGGGFRAAAFHLGVLEKLNDLGLINRIDVISTVSGGSIIGAFYLTHKDDFYAFKKLMIRNLELSLDKKIFLNWRVLRTFVNPSYSRTNVKAQMYSKFFFDDTTLSQLDEKPTLIINATNLATGKNWKFSQKFMGDWKLGYNGNPGSIRVADAVAASSAAPGVFHPLKIDVAKYFPDPQFEIKSVALCDGGIYDNQGIHALTSSYEEETGSCNNIICSDASFPFNDTPQKVSVKTLNVLKRQNIIMMARIKNMQYQELIYRHYRHRIKTAYFSINWSIDNLIKSVFRQPVKSCKNPDLKEMLSRHPFETVEHLENTDREFIKLRDNLGEVLNYPEFNDYLQPAEIDEISSIGTRFSRLTPKEIDLLIKHGSTLCGFQVRRFLEDIVS
ncbi:MAG: hypothetical protein GY754_01585 [bacterium]|nr:hypothetical protein [bacterium]